MGAGLLFQCLFFTFLARGCFGTIYLATCPALENQKGLVCSTRRGQLKNCTDKQEVGSTVECKKFFQPISGEGSKCQEDGTWTLPDFGCQIDCGRVNKEDKVRPFHGILKQAVKVNQTVKICSGTLIDVDLILTTRHCVVGVKGNVLDYDEISVQLGPEEKQNSKFGYSVEELYFPPSTVGNGKANGSDLAIVRLMDSVELSEQVLPICLPVCEQTDTIALRDGNFGEVMLEGGKAEKFVIQTSSECNQFNMVCAGHFEGTSLCQEETGLGITVPMIDSIYFLHGVLSNEFMTSCKHLRPFKRVFPYMDWINSVINNTADPHRHKEDLTTTPRPDFEIEEAVVLRPAFECTESSESTETDPFPELSPDQQSKLTSYVPPVPRVNSCSLLNNLRYATGLRKLNLTDVILTSTFEQKVTLPSLTHYILTTSQKLHPAKFLDYFPFTDKNGSAWELKDIANLGIDMTIENGIKFSLRPNPEDSSLGVSGINIADEVLSGLDSTWKWKALALTNVSVDIKSIPSSLTSLVLYESTVTGGTVVDVLKKTPKLEALFLSLSESEEIQTADLPLATLKELRLDRVYLTNSAGGWSDSYAVFKRLEHLFLSVGTSLDKNTQAGFLDIFKTTKRVTYLANEDYDLLRTILKLDSLEKLLFRVEKLNPEAMKFLAEVKFDRNSVDFQLDVVILRKMGDGGFNVTVLPPEKIANSLDEYVRLDTWPIE